MDTSRAPGKPRNIWGFCHLYPPVHRLYAARLPPERKDCLAHRRYRRRIQPPPYRAPVPPAGDAEALYPGYRRHERPRRPAGRAFRLFQMGAGGSGCPRGGDDLVVELPAAWASAPAERFAAGAVHILAGTGIVDAVSCGSESGDGAALEQAARALIKAERDPLLPRLLAEGKTYAAAREEAVRALCGAETAALLREPNNILALEYLKAAATEKRRAVPSPSSPSSASGRGTTATHRRAAPHRLPNCGRCWERTGTGLGISRRRQGRSFWTPWKWERRRPTPG